MSTSEHSMITRSKKKEMESQPPNNAGNNDDIDEQGNIKGLIDYTCEEDFDNDMFQKELRRLRGGIYLHIRYFTQVQQKGQEKKQNRKEKISCPIC